MCYEFFKSRTTAKEQDKAASLIERTPATPVPATETKEPAVAQRPTEQKAPRETETAPA